MRSERAVCDAEIPKMLRKRTNENFDVMVVVFDDWVEAVAELGG